MAERKAEPLSQYYHRTKVATIEPLSKHVSFKIMPQITDKGFERDFQWPLKEDIANLKDLETLRMAKLEVWRMHGYMFIAGVRVTLSNGMKSPIFKSEGALPSPSVLEFDYRQIAKIRLSCGKIINGLEF